MAQKHKYIPLTEDQKHKLKVVAVVLDKTQQDALDMLLDFFIVNFFTDHDNMQVLLERLPEYRAMTADTKNNHHKE